MIRKLSVSAAALAAFGFAVPAMAQTNLIGDGATVNIDITVQEIAILEVLDAAGEMTIDNDADNTMGNTTSELGGAITGGPASNRLDDYAQVRLMTNFQLDSIEIDAPWTNDIRDFTADPTGNTTFNGSGFDYFAAATGPGGNTLGVFPQVYNSDGFVAGAPYGPLSGTAGATASIQGTRDASGPNPYVIGSANLPANGLKDFAIGVSTNWSRTLLGEPLFAEPGTYTVILTATMIP